MTNDIPWKSGMPDIPCFACEERTADHMGNWLSDPTDIDSLFAVYPLCRQCAETEDPDDLLMRIEAKLQKPGSRIMAGPAQVTPEGVEVSPGFLPPLN